MAREKIWNYSGTNINSHTTQTNRNIYIITCGSNAGNGEKQQKCKETKKYELEGRKNAALRKKNMMYDAEQIKKNL